MAATDSILIPVNIDDKTGSASPAFLRNLRKQIEEVMQKQAQLRQALEQTFSTMPKSVQDSVKKTTLVQPVEVKFVDENGNEIQALNALSGKMEPLTKTLSASVTKDFEKERKEARKAINDNLDDIFNELTSASARVNRLTDILQKLRKREQKFIGKRGSTKYNVGGSLNDFYDNVVKQTQAAQKAVEQTLAQQDIDLQSLLDTAKQRMLSATLEGVDVSKPARRISSFEGKRKRSIETRMQKDREFSEFKKEEALKRAEEEVKLREKLTGSQLEGLFNDLIQYNKDIEKAYSAEEKAVHTSRSVKRRRQRIYPGNLTRGGKPIDPKLAHEMNQLENDASKNLIDSRVDTALAIAGYNIQHKEISDIIAAEKKKGRDVTKFEEALKTIDERRKRYLHALSTSRRQSAVNEKLEDVKTIEEASRIKENRKRSTQIENERNARNAKNARKERERQFNSRVMAVSSAALGLLGPAGFPLLNVGFATLSGGPMAGAVAGFTTALGEGYRALNTFQASLLSAADKIGAVAKSTRLAEAGLAGTKAGMSVDAQIGQRQRAQLEIEAYQKNVDKASALTYFETFKTAAFGTISDSITNWKETLIASSNAFGLLSPHHPLINYANRSREAFIDMQNSRLPMMKEIYEEGRKNLFKPYTSIDNDPMEVWRRIQTSALDPTKAMERRLAEETLNKLDAIIRKMEENQRLYKQETAKSSTPSFIESAATSFIFNLGF